jgi:hypothetical protein
MTEELTRNIRVIHRLERSIRVLELMRDGKQQMVDDAVAGYEKQGNPAQNDPAVNQAQAFIVVCNRAILGAKARINKLEIGDQERQ